MNSNVPEMKEPVQKKKSNARLWNILTLLILVIFICVLSYYALIFFNPNTILNPFPPPTLNPAAATLTPTVTPLFTMVPTWTPTKAPIPLANTPDPTETPSMVNNSVDDPTPIEPTPTPTQISHEYAFELQQGSPAAIAAAKFHQSAGCDWSGVAGQATSMNGEAVRGLFVQLGGSMPGEEQVNNTVMTGLAPQYGQGGFEITLADKPFATSGTLWIQLLDQQNLPLSDRIYFDTYDDCQKNLIIIYFTEVR